MSKMKVAILNALDGDKWLSVCEIATTVGYPRKSVSVTMASLFQEGSISKKDDPRRTGYALYRRSGAPAGFGTSTRLSQFDQLIRRARP